MWGRGMRDEKARLAEAGRRSGLGRGFAMRLAGPSSRWEKQRLSRRASVLQRLGGGFVSGGCGVRSRCRLRLLEQFRGMCLETCSSVLDVQVEVRLFYD